MNDKILWVVRHGQSKAQTGEEGVLDPGLSALGVEQARSLRSVFQGENFDHVRLSPLTRAWRTFELSLAGAPDVEFDSRIVECTLTRGASYDYTSLLPYRTPPIAASDRQDSWLLPPISRIASLVADLKRLPGRRILLVGHCAIFHILRCYLLEGESREVDYFSYDPEVILRNTAVGRFSLDTEGSGSELLSWNEVSHLEPEMLPTW